MVETIEQIELPDTARERYLRYAMSVITSRALPDVRDGLKPVQRRILYAMEVDLGLGRPDARPMKSSKVIGPVLGNYHPHGDQAIYDAMVRMAQPFSLRYPLVQGSGNFGAITGDNAAAIRYTEARLAPLGHELMGTLDEGTVPFRANYDGTGQEPEVLPTPLPMILLNGSTGIAVGMATNIPPHNLREVVKATTLLIDNPEATVPHLLRSIKGPDFPTGGELLSSKEDLRQLYEGGRGTFKLRGTYKVEETQGERQRLPRRSLVITSIPYGTTTAQVIAKVKDLLESKKLPQVGHISDQTTAKDGVRIVLELKPDVEPTLIAAALYKLTPLETTYGVNLTCLFPTGGPAGRPEQVGLKAILRAWLDFRFDVVTRSITFRRDRLLERIHILQGFAVVLADVNDAVKLVRAAQDREDARQRLMKRFKLDHDQAEAVLELRLYRLAQLEVTKVTQELKEKQAEVRRLEKLLAADKPRWDQIKKELEEQAERFGKGDSRQTKIVGGDDEAHEFDPSALVRREDTHVLLTRDGRLRRVKHLGDPAKVRLREEDELLAVAQGSTLSQVALFTNQGGAYVMAIHDVPPTAGFGEPVQKFFNFADGERVVAVVSLDARLAPASGEEATLVVATAHGNVAQVPLDAHREPSTRAGRRFVKLVEGDEVVTVELPEAGARHLLVATAKGNALRLPLADVPALAGVGKGKRALALEKGDRLVGATTRPKLHLETTRGARDDLALKNVRLGALGDAPAAIKQRGGFKRALPTLGVVDLPELGANNGGEA